MRLATVRGAALLLLLLVLNTRLAPARAQTATPDSPPSDARAGSSSAAPSAAAPPETPPLTNAAPAAPAPQPPADVQRFEGADVRASQAQPAAPGQAVTASPAEAGAVPQTMDEIPVAAINNRVSLNFFGDPALVFETNVPHHAGFVLNPLDFLITGRSGALIAMTEFAMEQAEGTVGIDIERMFVGWHGDHVLIDAGRTHAELGYWNNAFHHGRWLQLPVERPRIARFEDEGGILPIHWVGVTAHLRPLVDGDRRVEIVGAVGNGHGGIVDDILVEGDTNRFKALLAKIEMKGFGAADLRLGVSGSYDQIAPLPATAMGSELARPALPDATIREVITNAYVAYRGDRLTLISEAYDVFHSTSGLVPATGEMGRSWNTFDAFLLLGYRVGAFVPYALGELRRMSTGLPDPFFFPDATAPSDGGILRDFEELTVGLRWDLTTWSAIKIEYRGTFTDDSPLRHQRFIIDWSFGL